MSSSNWTTLGSPVTATAMLNTTDSVTNAPQRFYRLVLSPHGFYRSYRPENIVGKGHLIEDTKDSPDQTPLNWPSR